MSAPRFWDEEIQRAAEARGVSRRELEELMSLSRPGPRESEADPELREAAIIQALRPLLVACAEALEEWGGSSSADSVAAEEAARAGLSTVALAADLLEIAPLTDWATRLSKTGDLRVRAREAGRMLRGEAFEIVWSKSLAELRACRWDWPEPTPESQLGPEPRSAQAAAPAQFVLPLPRSAAGPAAEPPAESPAADAPAVETPPAPTPALPSARQSGPLRALVADQSVIAGGFLARLLRQRGVDVLTVEDSSAAESALASSGFDLIFVDMDWPDPRTRETLAAGVEQGRVVFVGADPRDAHRASEPGTRFLLKPPSAEELDSLLAATPQRRIPAPRSPR